MEDERTKIIGENLNLFKENKVEKLSEEVVSALLPASTSGDQDETKSSDQGSPAPPTPPMEKEYIRIEHIISDNLLQETDLAKSKTEHSGEEVDIENALPETNMANSPALEMLSNSRDLTSAVGYTVGEEKSDLILKDQIEPKKHSLNDSYQMHQELKDAMDPLAIPCLQSIKELRKRYGSKYKLHFKFPKGSNRYLSSYRRKWDLLLELEDWENALNSSSPQEPYISVENKVDNCGPPKDFIYITKNILSSSVDYLFDKNYLVGCECVRCTPQTCDCTKNSGSDFAYDRIGKVLFEPGKPIYECNSSCCCSVSCRNRVVQRGRTVRVTIFRTPNGCGWGVKTMDPILKNQFVTEYVGEVLTSEEAEKRGKLYDHVGMTYLFDLDYNDGYASYTIDAKTYGNISHFINHSCDPNLSVYGVWIETLDPQMPQIAFFARRDIKVGEELTFDYLMYTEASSKSKSKPKPVPCFCGSKNCRKYML